jgi:transcriptional regulator with XRE-family HTH domain
VGRAETVRRENPIATRIRNYCANGKISLRDLSKRAILSASTAQKVCDRLERDEGDVGLDTLDSLAKAMGVTLVWLLYGDNPPDTILLRALPGWKEAAREAIDRLGADPAQVELIGGWHLHEAPTRLDGIFVASLARAWTTSR